MTTRPLCNGATISLVLQISLSVLLFRLYLYLLLANPRAAASSTGQTRIVIWAFDSWARLLVAIRWMDEKGSEVVAKLEEYEESCDVGIVAFTSDGTIRKGVRRDVPNANRREYSWLTCPRRNRTCCDWHWCKPLFILDAPVRETTIPFSPSSLIREMVRECNSRVQSARVRVWLVPRVFNSKLNSD